MRVLMLSPEFPPLLLGGLGTHVFNLASALQRFADRIDVFIPSPSKGGVYETSNIRAEFCVSKAGPLSRFGRVQVLERADALVRAITSYISRASAPDIIHCHEWFMYPAARELRLRFGIPIVSTLHLSALAYDFWGEDPSVFALTQEQEMCRDSDGVIAVSRSIAELVSRGHRVADNRFRVIHNGVPVLRSDSADQASISDAKKRFGLPDNSSALIVYAGRMTPQKGILEMLKSAESVLEECPDVSYAIAGDFRTRYGESVTTYIAEHPRLRDRVRLLGKLRSEELVALYKCCDLAVVPSVYEPFGYAAIEPMGLGIPVVASDCGGLAEIIEHEVSGLLVPTNQGLYGVWSCDVTCLAAAQLRLLRDVTLRRELGTRGALRVAKYFGSGHMAELTSAFYGEILRRLHWNHSAVVPADVGESAAG